MAKVYKKVFKDSAETQYASGIAPLLSLAKLNKGVKFSKIQQSNGVAGSISEYAIQRMLRIKARDSGLNKAADEASADAGSFGTDFVAELDAMTKIQWDTVTTVTGKERIIGVYVDPKEEVSALDDAAPYEKVITNKVKNTLIEGEEKAIAKLISAVTPGTLAITSAQAAADGIMAEVFKTQELVDNFKAYSDNVVVFVHPRVAKLMGELEGQGYQQGTNTFPEGKGKGFRYQGIDFFVSPILNSQGSTPAKVPGAIIMDAESYANAGIDNNMVPFDEKYLGTRVIGHRYNELDVVIDPSRISVLEITITGPTGIVKSKTVKAA